MVTKAFKERMVTLLTAYDTSTNLMYGNVQVISTGGVCYYMGNTGGFPTSQSYSLQLKKERAGISVGSSTAEDSDEYINLLSTITEGITGSVATPVKGIDEDNNPYVDFFVTINNTSESPVTIGEIGYKQGVMASIVPFGTDRNTVTILIDRTKLEPSVTIQPGASETIQYRLKTSHKKSKTVNGVKIVPFAFGTDEEIFAMIDAARNGVIDLQTDGGWAVWDKRNIQVSGFTADGNAVDSHTGCVAISKFGDYNDCGAVMQLDFITCIPGVRMNSIASNEGGYHTSIIRTSVMPAFYEAMPSQWKSRMLTFSVVSGTGGGEYHPFVTEGCKMALRSAEELRGANDYSRESESNNQIDMYKTAESREKYNMSHSSVTGYYWTRSAYVYSGNSKKFVAISYRSQSDNILYAQDANNTCAVAPFFCV